MPATFVDTYERVYGACGGAAVTPSDTLSITPNGSGPATVYRALWVGGGGNIAVFFADGSTATLTGAVTGSVIPVCFTRVNATNTTATLLVALL